MMIQGIESHNRSGCPSRKLLLAMSVGQLRGAVRVAVESHFENCDACLAELQSVDDSSDPLIVELRGPADPAAGDEEIFREPTRRDGVDPRFGRADRTGDSQASATNDRPVPERLGDYRLVEPLGRGGMGVVYRAWHTRLGQVRALKVLRPDRAGDRRAIERFQREITTLGGLEHPNLVRAFDAREEAGVIFLVMEFVEGLDLWRLLARSGAAPRLRLLRSGPASRDRPGVRLPDARHGPPRHQAVEPDDYSRRLVKVLDLGIARIDPAARAPLDPGEPP